MSGWPLKSRLSSLNRGFDVYDEFFSPLEALHLLVLPNVFKDWGLVSDLRLRIFGVERRGDVTNRAVFRWLRETSEEPSPFFLWVHYFDPHRPYEAPFPYSRMYYAGNEKDPANRSMRDVASPSLRADKPGVTDINFYIASYDGEVTWTDHLIGELLDEITSLGLRDRTLVVLTADHGESLTEHDHYFGHGDLFEPCVHVPLIFAGPDLAKEKVITEQTQSVDIAPTLLASEKDAPPGYQPLKPSSMSRQGPPAITLTPASAAF